MESNNEIVIIGCGAGGGTAAQFARKTDRKAKITIIEKGKYPQYSKCGLPYAISGDIPKLSDLIEFSEEWFKKANIELFLGTTVEKIDPKNKIIIAKKGNSTIEKNYTSLIIATGAKPQVPPIKNIFEDGKLIDGCFILRTIDDAQKIISYLEKTKNAVVIGAGFIGLEMADTLYKKKKNVTIVEALTRILPNNLDEEMSKIVYDDISKKINIFLNNFVTAIESKSGKINNVIIKNRESGDEKKITADLLIVAAGIKPDTELAKEVGCKLNEKGYIVVNEKCETTVKNIYSIGDCTEFKDFVTKKPVPIGLGSIVVRQGVTAGTNAAGGSYFMPNGVLQTCTSEFFDLEVAAVGTFNENLVSGKFTGLSLPHYFPGGKTITLKVFTDEKGKIFGAQAIGNNAAKRINTFASAILAGLDIETFKKLETAYAPPIAPTLDAETLVCDIISMKLSRKR